MYLFATLICLTLSNLSQADKSTQNANCLLHCEVHKGKAVCGGDGTTYKSFCELQKQECVQGINIGFKCNGNCPCDPVEVEKMDPDTVRKIQSKRAEFQLAEHEKEELNYAQDYFTLEILDEKDIVKHIEKVQKKEKPVCSSSEMSELPARLIDWFHVLKINEKVQEMEDQHIEQEPVMKEENFTNEKIRAMYSTLACTEQKDEEIEKAVCLKPVKWMFHHLDVDNNNFLSATELAEIEEIENEHCIKPFLQSCDFNKDGKVVLSEFCRCLCITPPCTTLIKDLPTIVLRGVPVPMPGFFVPRCDDDGFFMPEQCNPRKECWCVDRNGAELGGTRKTKGKKPKCAAYNTKNPGKKLYPLEVKKENKQK